MIAKRLDIAHFKNITEAEITLSPRLNCFTGNNGAGKTNLLDALHLLAMCKSFFLTPDSQAVQHNEEFFSIKGIFERDERDGEFEVSCAYSSRTKKVFQRDKERYSRLSDHIGTIPLVMITPGDLLLVDGGSEERRNWLDGVISQSDRGYLRTLITYSKVLQRRNLLLKEAGGNLSFDYSRIEAWDEQMATAGDEILARRRAFLEEFTPIFNRYYSRVASEEEQVSLEYRESTAEYEDTKSALTALFKRDLILGYSTVGAHRDDLTMKLGEHPIKRVGSQGQKKSFIVALKLAQYDWLHEHCGEKPLLLLDDIFDKLDAGRVEHLLQIVGDESFGQIFITDTDYSHIEDMVKSICGEYALFMVHNGEVSDGTK